MKVIFLDIDGVLNTFRSFIAKESLATPRTLIPNVSDALFDEVSVGLVRRICDQGVVCVLSSSWRFAMSHETIGEAINIPIVDSTPSNMGLNARRGKEIQAWLDKHPEVTHWAILDDDADMLPEQMDRLVQTSFEDGILMSHFNKLCELLDVTCLPK